MADPQIFIIEGLDRLGKSGLISQLQDALGHHTIIHYDRPKPLTIYSDDLYEYQYNSFVNMFNLLDSDAKIIFDRAHLGEYVYSPRYRGYDGSYVFKLEVEAAMKCNEGLKESEFFENVRLVLLYTTDFSFIEDDGQSFDFNRKEEEQESFIEAFKHSHFSNKIMVDVSNGKGGYKTREDILREVLES